ncbi:MAG: tryptophan 7-halogenase [Timaviella obliquedivisa GSE-PSE-MK23-08B]|nr:tryptophan 7-halogenase [Timaviella obliquedivisa GSE-PSE-MK23-08B]
MNCDVVIIGSGPAGAAAAIAAAQLGLEVILLEAQAFPRSRPGETLHPGVEPLLQQMGVLNAVLSAGFLRHTGNWVQWEGDRQFAAFGADESGAWQGFQAVRADLDALLLAQAQTLGVTVLHPCRALGLLSNDKGRVVGVNTTQGKLRSAAVVDAAGGNHWGARQMGLSIQHYAPHLTAYYGYVTGDCSVRDGAPAIAADEQGWTWTAKVRHQLYQWTRLSFVEPPPRHWLPPEFTGLTVYQPMRGADVTWRKVSQPAGEGYFLVGDAATVLDPTSSHGVLRALMSGRMAGNLIAQCLKNKCPEQQAIQHYCEWINQWFQHDVDKLRQLYRMLPNSPEWLERYSHPSVQIGQAIARPV